MKYVKTTDRQRKDEAAGKVKYRHVSMPLVAVKDELGNVRFITQRQANGTRGSTYNVGNNQRKRDARAKGHRARAYQVAV